MKLLGLLLVVVAAVVGSFYFATAGRSQNEQPMIYYALGPLAHVLAWAIMALGIVGLVLLL